MHENREFVGRVLFVIEPCFHGARYIRAANELDADGFECSVVVVRREDGPPLPPGQAEILIADVLSAYDVRDKILEWCKNRDVDSFGLLPGNEYCVPVAAEVCHLLDLPGNIPIAGYAARDKRLMRYALKAARVSSPTVHVFESAKVFEKAVEGFDYPVVVKPPDMACSLHVKLCLNADELRAAGNQILYRQHNLIGYPLVSAVMVEEYMEGPEFSVELFLADGRQLFCSLTEKEKSPTPFFVELGHVVPSSISTEQQSAALTASALRAALALGITNGPVHAEIIMSEDGPKVVELAARLPGGNITDLLRLAWGVDLHKAAVQQALGVDPTHIQAQVKPRKGAAIKFVCASPGKVLSIRGLGEARASQGVTAVELYVNRGDLINILRSSEDRIGYVIATGRDGSEAKDNARRAADKIVIHTNKND